MFENLKSFIVKKLGAIPYVSSMFNWSSFLGSRSTLDYYTGWVFACVMRIARSFANVNFKLYRLKKNGEVEEVDDHPLLSLLWKFNSRFTAFDSKELIAIYFLIYGYAPLIMMGGEKPTELWVVPPSNMKIKNKDEYGYPLSWEYQIGTWKKEISARDVLNLWNPNPASPSEGLSVLGAVQTVADIDEYSKKWNKNLMINSARPSVAMEIEGSLTDKEAKILRKRLEETYGGYENAHKVAILTNGAKLSPITIPPKDLEFIAGRQMNRDEIMGIFGVPKILLGLEGDYNRATAETAERVFAKYTIEPIVEKISQQWNEFLVPRFGDDLWLGYEPLATEDRELQLMKWDRGIDRFLTINDIRQEIGLSEVEGGDVLYRGVMEIPIGGGKKEKINLQNLRIKKGLSIKLQEKIRRNISNRQSVKSKLLASDIGRNIKRNLEKNNKGFKIRLVKEEDVKREWYKKRFLFKSAMEKKWKEAMVGYFKDLEERVLEGFKSRKKSVADRELPDIEKEKTVLVSILEPEYIETVKAGVEQAYAYIGKPVEELWKRPHIQKWIKYIADKYGGTIVNTEMEKLQSILGKAVEEHLSVAETAKQFREHFDAMSYDQSEMIARTETARALAEAHIMTWKEEGYEKVEWILADNPCELCVAKSRQEWTVETIQGEQPVHPNCECDQVPLPE